VGHQSCAFEAACVAGADFGNDSGNQYSFVGSYEANQENSSTSLTWSQTNLKLFLGGDGQSNSLNRLYLEETEWALRSDKYDTSSTEPALAYQSNIEHSGDTFSEN
jgi:hypothetical protein